MQSSSRIRILCFYVSSEMKCLVAFVTVVGPLYNVHVGKRLIFTFEANCVMSDGGSRQHPVVPWHAHLCHNELCPGREPIT